MVMRGNLTDKRTFDCQTMSPAKFIQKSTVISSRYNRINTIWVILDEKGDRREPNLLIKLGQICLLTTRNISTEIKYQTALVYCSDF